MIKEIEKMLGEYTKWLKDKTVLKQIDTNWVEITTPYLDRHNDCLQFYARKDSNGFLLTDDGYIVNDLKICGCPIDTPKRRDLLQATIAGFGVQLDHDQLIIHTTDEKFSLKKHNLIQAMLAVNDLFYLASPYISHFFFEDVTEWLEILSVSCIAKAKFAGKSGYDHMFSFVIPKSKKSQNALCKQFQILKKNLQVNLFLNGQIQEKQEILARNFMRFLTILVPAFHNLSSGL